MTDVPDPTVPKRGLYEGLGLFDSARTRRPQKRALVEATRPASQMQIAELRDQIAALAKRVQDLEEQL